MPEQRNNLNLNDNGPLGPEDRRLEAMLRSLPSRRCPSSVRDNVMRTLREEPAGTPPKPAPQEARVVSLWFRRHARVLLQAAAVAAFALVGTAVYYEVKDDLRSIGRERPTNSEIARGRKEPAVSTPAATEGFETRSARDLRNVDEDNAIRGEAAGHETATADRVEEGEIRGADYGTMGIAEGGRASGEMATPAEEAVPPPAPADLMRLKSGLAVSPTPKATPTPATPALKPAGPGATGPSDDESGVADGYSRIQRKGEASGGPGEPGRATEPVPETPVIEARPDRARRQVEESIALDVVQESQPTQTMETMNRGQSEPAAEVEQIEGERYAEQKTEELSVGAPHGRTPAATPAAALRPPPETSATVAKYAFEANGDVARGDRTNTVVPLPPVALSWYEIQDVEAGRRRRIASNVTQSAELQRQTAALSDTDAPTSWGLFVANGTAAFNDLLVENYNGRVIETEEVRVEPGNRRALLVEAAVPEANRDALISALDNKRMVAVAGEDKTASHQLALGQEVQFADGMEQVAKAIQPQPKAGETLEERVRGAGIGRLRERDLETSPVEVYSNFFVQTPPGGQIGATSESLFAGARAFGGNGGVGAYWNYGRPGADSALNLRGATTDGAAGPESGSSPTLLAQFRFDRAGTQPVQQAFKTTLPDVTDGPTQTTQTARLYFLLEPDPLPIEAPAGRFRKTSY